jgi:hypothetical protein
MCENGSIYKEPGSRQDPACLTPQDLCHCGSQKWKAESGINGQGGQEPLDRQVRLSQYEKAKSYVQYQRYVIYSRLWRGFSAGLPLCLLKQRPNARISIY